MEFLGNGLFPNARACQHPVHFGITNDKIAKDYFFVSHLVAIALGIYVFRLYRTPLGPALYSADVTPLGRHATWTSDPASVSNGSSVKTYGACNALSPLTILAIGSDTRGEGYLYGLADVIRLVRVDFVNPKVTVLEIPRDLWVEIPDIADNLNGQDHEKLNQAYLYGNRGFGYTDDPAEGPGLLARTLTLNFGTQIDNYAAVNMYTFTKIVDAVGGIEVTLPKAVDGRKADDMNDRLLFPAGTHLSMAHERSRLHASAFQVHLPAPITRTASCAPCATN